MFSGGAEESTEETSESFQGQEVCEDCVFIYVCFVHPNGNAKNNFLYMFSSFLLDRLLQYERVDEDSSGRLGT